MQDKEGNVTKLPFRGREQKWQAYYIAPLQPPTLAIFRSWGSSAGAGRVRPAAANIRELRFRILEFDFYCLGHSSFGRELSTALSASNFRLRQAGS